MPGPGALLPPRRPVVLVHLELESSRSTAQKREAAIKSLSRAEKMSMLKPPQRYADDSNAMTR